MFALSVRTAPGSKRRTARRLSILMLALGPWPAAAASHGAPIEEIMVTAPREHASTVPSLEAARAAARSIAGGVSVLDAAEIRLGRAATPDDALQYAPGVFVASRFGAEESRLSIRGSGLQRTFHGRGVMFLQDGVPLNLADGSGDFQAMEPLAASYIEVFRGANALQLGSTTLGGAVNFASPGGDDGATEVRMEGGSFGYRRLYGSAGASAERFDAFASVSHYGREGFQHHSAQSTQRLMANAGYRVSDGLEHRVFLAAVRTDSELPGALTEGELRRGDVRNAAPGNVIGDNKRDFDLLRVAYRASWLPDPGRKLEFGAFYSAKQLSHPIFQVLEQDSDDFGVNLRLSLRAPFGRHDDRLVLGARAARGDTRDDRFVNAAGARGSRIGKSDQRADHATLYGEYSLGLGPRWTLVAGLQGVSAGRRFDDLCHADTVPACAAPDRSFGTRYRAWLPRLGVIHDLDDSVQFFANVARQYEPPSFGEISGGPGVDLLEAQRGTTYELGTRGRVEARPSTEWDASLYWMELGNELLALQVAPNTYRTVNADQTRHRGVELGVSADLPGNWQARLHYQLNDFRFVKDAEYGNNRIAGVPRHAVKAEITWRTFAERAYVTAIVTGASSSWVDHRNRVDAPGYGVFTLRAGAAFTPALSGFIEGRNLTDRIYAATHGVVGDAAVQQFGQPQRLFNPGDGRAFYAGLTWALR